MRPTYEIYDMRRCRKQKIEGENTKEFIKRDCKKNIQKNAQATAWALLGV